MAALKISVGELLDRIDDDGKAVRIQGEKITEVRVMGRVVDLFRAKNGKYGELILDDETGIIDVKFFSRNLPRMDPVQLGDLVEIKGHVNEYQGNAELVAGEIAVFEDFNWELLRKLELAFPRKGLEDKVCQFIESRDGATKDDLEARFGAEVEKTLQKLLIKGDVYESSPGEFSVVA